MLYPAPDAAFARRFLLYAYINILISELAPPAIGTYENYAHLQNEGAGQEGVELVFSEADRRAIERGGASVQ